MGREFERPTARALLVVRTEPYDIRKRTRLNPVRLLTALIRQFVAKIRP